MVFCSIHTRTPSSSYSRQVNIPSAKARGFQEPWNDLAMGTTTPDHEVG
jgi:hypothetical protein